MKWLIWLFLPVISVSVILGRSIETSVAADGAGRWQGLLLYTSRPLSAGGTCRFLEDGSIEGLAGLNTSGFSIGHLGDAGLASEVRNPGYDSLSRLAEPTVYRADLRSISHSRLGIAVMPWDARVGVVWERRKDIEAGIIWVVPFSTDYWSLELLGEVGLLLDTISSESWYPDVEWRPDGPFSLLSGRLRYQNQGTITGATVMLSGGVNLLPGWLTAISANYFKGPVRIRTRLIYSSPYFRTADGERLEIPVGGSFDCRYRPAKGLQTSAEYRGGGDTTFIDGGSAAIGWRFGETQISLESDWNRVFSSNQKELPACRRLKVRLIWDRHFLHLGWLGTWEPEEGWSIKLENTFPAQGLWLVESYLRLHRESGPLLLDFRLKGRLDFGANRLILSIFAGDFMRDWESGPTSAGDFEVELRWIIKFD